MEQRMAMTLAFAAMFCASTGARAGECDCVDGDCDNLPAVEGRINDWLAYDLAQAVDEVEDVKEDYRDKFGKEIEDHTAYLNALYRRIGKPYRGILTKYENTLHHDPRSTLHKHKSATKYKFTDGWDALLWVSASGAGVLSPCINLCGECVGLDKVGHFFQQGWGYFTKQMTAGTAAANAWNRGTEFVVSGSPGTGYLGQMWAVTGVASSADMYANRMGADFYRKVRKVVKSGGPGAITSASFDICDYVDANWSEEINLNSYNAGVGAAVAKVGRK